MALDVLTPDVVFSSQSPFSEVFLHPCTLLPIFSRLLPSTSPVSKPIMASNTIPPRPRGQRKRDTKETQTDQPAQPSQPAQALQPAHAPQATQGPQPPMVNILSSNLHYPTFFTPIQDTMSVAIQADQNRLPRAMIAGTAPLCTLTILSPNPTRSPLEMTTKTR